MTCDKPAAIVVISGSVGELEKPECKELEVNAMLAKLMKQQVLVKTWPSVFTPQAPLEGIHTEPRMAP